MEDKVQNAIESYQCAGCTNGGNIDCFQPNYYGGVGCGKHSAGTIVFNLGKMFLGLPKGFCRLGFMTDLIPHIYNSFDESEGMYDMFNIPVWKYLNPQGHTLVRGLMPRLNEPFLHIYLEDCRNEISCLEITDFEIAEMD